MKLQSHFRHLLQGFNNLSNRKRR